MRRVGLLAWVLPMLLASCDDADERSAGEVCESVARVACTAWQSCDLDAPLVPECMASVHKLCCAGVDCGAAIEVTESEEERCATLLSHQLCVGGASLPEPCRNLRDRAPHLQEGGASFEILQGTQNLCRLGEDLTASAVANGGVIRVVGGCGSSVEMTFATPIEGGSADCATVSYQVGSAASTCTLASYYTARSSGRLTLTGSGGFYRVKGACKCGTIEARFDLPLEGAP